MTPGAHDPGDGGGAATTLRRCVVAGGAGAVGEMLAGLLAGFGAEVTVVDPAPARPGRRHIRADVTAPTPAAVRAVRRADLVLLCLAERTALASVDAIVAEMREGALLAHTASVQSRLAAAVAAAAGRVEAVGLNPMFAPALGPVGRPVAAVVLRDGPRVAELLRLLSAAGARVVRLEAEAHDRLCAASQALTHAAVLAFGLGLAELDVDVEALGALAPPPHATMLALLARVASGTPEVYWDVQTANPHAAAARAALARGLRAVGAATHDEAAFAAALGRGREALGDELATYRGLCTRIFDITREES
jgi:prephenate dehydrogenase